MVTLDEIQKMVTKAQEEMKKEHYDFVRQRLWPDIDDVLGQYTNIGSQQRMQWRDRIYNRLFGQNLQSAEPPHIKIEDLLGEVMNGPSPLEPPTAPEGILP